MSRMLCADAEEFSLILSTRIISVFFNYKDVKHLWFLWPDIRTYSKILVSNANKKTIK